MRTRVACLAASTLFTAGCGTTPAPAPGLFLGVKAVVYPVRPGDAAAAWYAQLLGETPSNPVLGDAGFAIGDTQLALESRTQPGSTLAVWEVADIDAAFGRLLALGAVPVTGIQEIGDARVAIVRDPFGNLLGLTDVGALQQH